MTQKITFARLIDGYSAPQYLIQEAAAPAGRRVIARLQEQLDAGTLEILDRNVRGWGPANTIVRGLDGEDYERIYLVHLLGIGG